MCLRRIREEADEEPGLVFAEDLKKKCGTNAVNRGKILTICVQGKWLKPLRVDIVYKKKILKSFHLHNK